MARRKVSNPLALAVLALLGERPMHPYEMSSTLRYRAKEASIKLNYGSLYSVVQSLQRHELIEVHETVREGNRPERTVYGITERGQIELIDWMSELISTPVKEYPQFEAALSLMPVLPPDDVVRLLRARLIRLELEKSSSESMMIKMREAGLPELLAVEGQYADAMRAAEITFVRQLVDKIENNTLGGIEAWRDPELFAKGAEELEQNLREALQDAPSRETGREGA